MAVRAKFKCTNIRDTNPGASDGLKNIRLEAVTADSDENKKFFKYTPWGKLEVSCVNPEANKQFEEGKEYYIDISEAK